MAHNLFNSLRDFDLKAGEGGQSTGKFYSLPALEEAGVGRISRLPVSIRIVLEAILRNCDDEKVSEAHVRQLANWAPNDSLMRAVTRLADVKSGALRLSVSVGRCANALTTRRSTSACTSSAL